LHVARRFERLLDAHRRPDGSRWTGQRLDEATGGVVTRSYVTNLRKGRIESPGYEKMLAIARAMGFPPEAWFEEGVGRAPTGLADDGRGIAGRVEHLFDAVRNPKTGEPYTNAEVARMTLGGLSEDDIEGIRTEARSATRPWARLLRSRVSLAWSPHTCWTGTRRSGRKCEPAAHGLLLSFADLSRVD
jgi:transcriptional regulator with XRE-family HTH domain